MSENILEKLGIAINIFAIIGIIIVMSAFFYYMP